MVAGTDFMKKFGKGYMKTNPDTIKSKKEEILRAFDKVINPLYLEVEASIAEDLHCRIAEKTQELIDEAVKEEQERARKIVEGWKICIPQSYTTEVLDDILSQLERGLK